MAGQNEAERKTLLSFASRVDRNDPGALNNLGVLYFRKDMYEEAIEQFKEALRVDPRFDLARENLQYLFSETKLEDPDVQRWQEEVDHDSENVEALYRLGVSHHNMGRFREASEVLLQVIEKSPGHVTARIYLGSALKAQGRYQEALEHYITVRDDVSTSAVYHTDLGEVYYNLGKTEEAILELRTAIKLDASYWRSHFLLSFAYGDNGQLQEALEESRIASRLNPSFQNTEANLALSNYGRDGIGDTGIGSCKEAASLESTSYTLGVAYRERGFAKEALKEFQKALDEMPDKDRVYIEMGKIHLSEDNRDDAESILRKALEMNEESALAYKLLGCVYHIQGALQEAAACYLQAYRLNAADADVMNNLGVLLYQVGLIEDAEKMLKKGLNLKLYHMELNYNFLTCHLLKEEYMMVENLIQRLEAFMGKSTILYEKRALLHFKLNRLTLALFDIESAISIDRKNSDALYLKSLIFLREEDYEGAVRAVLEAANICPRYTGLSFFIALGDFPRKKSPLVDSKLSSESGEELIELLQAGLVHRYDNLDDFLTPLLSGKVKEVVDEDEGEPGSEADDDEKGGHRKKASELLEITEDIDI